MKGRIGLLAKLEQLFGVEHTEARGFGKLGEFLKDLEKACRGAGDWWGVGVGLGKVGRWGLWEKSGE